MRVGIIITRGDDVGGAQVHVKDLCRGLKVRGADVSVITGGTGRFAAILQDDGVQVLQSDALARSVNPIKDMAAYKELRQLVASIRPGLISLHSSKAGILGRMVSRSLGIPCVFTAHGWAFTEGVPALKRRLFSFIERAMAPLAGKIISVSNYDYNLAVKAGIPTERMTQIHNGIACGDPSEKAQHRDSSNPRAIMVARFGVPKDHVALLRALALVPSLELDLVGEGATLESVRSEAGLLGLNHRVRFLGYRDDTAKCLRAADIFCLISNYEGFPYTTLEAMREGLPTLVSDVGGAGEAAVEGQTGFLIPRGNVEMLAQRLTLLADNSELRRQMGSAAREHFLANFTFDRMFTRTLQVYEQVLAGRN